MTNHYTNILVAVDGSEESYCAFKKAIQVSKQNIGSTLHIAHVIDERVFISIDRLNVTVIENIRNESKELLDKYLAEALEAGLEKVNVILEQGAPKVVISKTIPKKINADLIICGATGKNAVDRLLIGSISQEIVRKAKCDVLVTRNPEQ